MTMGDVENSNNNIENHRSKLEKIFYILQIILKQIDHIPVILIILLFVSTAIPGWFTEFECVGKPARARRKPSTQQGKAELWNSRGTLNQTYSAGGDFYYFFFLLKAPRVCNSRINVMLWNPLVRILSIYLDK